jgi:cytochrome c553
MKNTFYGLMICILFAACSKEPESTAPVVDLVAGKVIAENDCSDCHGIDGRGETAEIPNIAAQSVSYLVEAMHAYRDGGRLHAALQDMTTGMSESDITNIAGYYASQPPLPPLDDAQISVMDNDSYREGAAIAGICEDCHGEKGISTEEGVPSLAGQQPVYLIFATRAYKKGERGHEDKEDMLRSLKQIDVEKMAMYFASQSAPERQAPSFGDAEVGKASSANCGKCHGARGISHDPMIPSLAGQEPVYLVNAIKAFLEIESDCEAQQPHKTDQQIQDIAAYYSIQKTQASIEQDVNGQELAAKCDRCHAPTKRQRKVEVPSLNGQSRDYLISAMKEYRGEDRDNSMMHKMSSKYNDEMIEAIASYYAGQSN